MKNGSVTTIDHAGRIVVPKSIREQAGLVPGTRMTVRLRAGCVELEPEPRTVRIQRRGRMWVAESVDDGSTLSAGQVRETLDKIRRREA